MKATEYKPSTLESTGNKTVAELSEVGRDALNTGKGYLEDFTNQYGDKMQQGLNTAKGALKNTSGEVNAWVKKNPLASLGIALGAGLVIGKLFMSKRE